MGVLRVEVSDTGEGLTAEEQSAMFGEFIQFNRKKLQGGGRSPSLRTTFDLLMNAFLFCSLAVGIRWLWIGTMDFPAHCRHAQGIRFSLSLVSSSSCLLIAG